MSLRVATWNLQRDHSGRVLEDCKRIIWENPGTYFCFQEVTGRMRDRLSQVLQRHFAHADENMIVSAEGVDVENPQVLYFWDTSRSFLQAEIPVMGWIYMLLTGKLAHGPFFIERYKVLKRLYALYRDFPTILALDGNHVIPGEFLVTSTLLKRYWFWYTHHPEGTHDIRRLEWWRFGFLPTMLARRQLDRILSSSHFTLDSSEVFWWVNSSDHEPLIANLTLIRQ